MTIRLLGSPLIQIDDQSVRIRLRKGLALLAFLAVEGGKQRRDRLAALLWPGYRQQGARGNLRRTLSTLNQSLPGTWFHTTRQTIGLDPEADIRIDVQELRALSPGTASMQKLAAAADLIRGPFLDGFSLDDAPEFDSWQSQESQYWSRQAGHLFERLIRHHVDQQTWTEGIVPARRWVALDPLNEEAHRLLMQLHGRAGERSAALAQFEECARVLETELSLAPEAATIRLRDRIRAGELTPERQNPLDITRVANEGQPAKPPPLPLPSTPFLGRRAELDRIRHSLVMEADCRLLTLLGPGGSGKSRLALAVGQALTPHFADGVYFAPLAGVESPSRLESAVASALDFTFYSGQDPRSQLCSYLADKSALLILDNYEHLLDGADLATDLLSAAPGLRILVTSRQRLSLQQEWLLDIEGLPFPQSVGGPHGESLEAYTAVALFVERARRSQAGFTLTAQNAPHVLQICQLTDGLPLALELAATWTRLMTPREIALQIGADLDFLQANLRDLPPRHRSLRAVFEHSWRLLPPKEQQILARLSIFRSGFRSDAAREVAGASPSLLLNLADKSLIYRDEDGRFTIHELMRQFSAEHLANLPDLERESHVRFQDFMARFLAERHGPLTSGDQPQTLVEITPEIDNILQAWPFLHSNSDYVTVANAFASLLWYMETRSRHLEFAGFLGHLTDLAEHERPRFTRMTEAGFLMLAAMDLRMSAAALLRLGDADGARSAAMRSLDVMEPIRGQPLGRHKLGLSKMDVSISYDSQWAWNRLQLALIEVSKGNYQLAREHGVTAEGTFQKIGYLLGRSVAQRVLGQVSRSVGAYTQARSHFEASLSTVAVLGKPAAYHASILDNLGRLDLWLGHYPAALTRVQSALGLRRFVRDPSLTAASLRHLGQIWTAIGNYDHAQEAYVESLALLNRLGDCLQLAGSRYELGVLALLRADYARAQEDLQHALEAYEELGNRRGMALAWLRLGAVHLAVGQLPEAETATRQGYQLSANLPTPWLLVQAESAMGTVRHTQESTQQALQHYSEALHKVRNSEAVPLLIETLVSSLQVLTETDASEVVLQVAQLACRRPETSYHARNRAQQHLTELDATEQSVPTTESEILTSVTDRVIQRLSKAID